MHENFLQRNPTGKRLFTANEVRFKKLLGGSYAEHTDFNLKHDVTTKNARKKRDTGGAENWPRRFTPQPVLGVGGVALCLRAGVIFNQIVQ